MKSEALNLEVSSLEVPSLEALSPEVLLNSSPVSSYGISNLVLTNYRSHKHFALEFCPEQSVILIGPNGAGKTNVLEAVSYLVPGRGLRHAPVRDLAHRSARALSEEKSWSVFAKIQDREELFTVATGTTTGTNPNESSASSKERRVLLLNGKNLRQRREVLERLWVVSLTPDIDSLLRDAAQTRRRFFDNLVMGIYPQHADNLNYYEKALRERMALLAQARWDPQWMQQIESQLVNYGIIIAELRVRAAELINHAVAHSITKFPRAQVQLSGETEQSLMTLSALQAELQMSQQLRDSRAKDQQTGICHVGPHRTDVVLFYLEKEIEGCFASTGEQKALIISLVLATTRLYLLRKKGVPLLLLDEVVAHLDKKVRGMLMKEIAELGIQTWMTGTEVELFAEWGRAKIIHHLGRVDN